MMIKRIQLLILMIGLASLAGGILGCATNEDSTSSITVWHQKTGAERVFFNKIVAEYNAEHPEQIIKPLYKETEDLRRLFVMASVGGQGPDLVFGPADNIGLFSVTETIKPLEEIFDSTWFNQFTEDGIVSWDDHKWLAADQIGNHLTFVYNKKMMPVPPTTIEELLAITDSLTIDSDGDGKIDQYGLTWNYKEPFFFIPFLTGFGGWVMDEDGNPSLDNPETVEAIQFILDLRDKYAVIPSESDYDLAETLFKEGRAAAIINGPWAWTGYADAGIDYGIAPLPTVTKTGLACAPMVSAKGYSINVTVSDDRLPMVKEVLSYLVSEEVQARMVAELATIPVNQALMDSSEVLNTNPILVASRRQIELGRRMPIEPRMRQIWDGMRGAYQLVMNGSVSATEGAKRMQETCEKLIQDTFL